MVPYEQALFHVLVDALEAGDGPRATRMILDGWQPRLLATFTAIARDFRAEPAQDVALELLSEVTLRVLRNPRAFVPREGQEHGLLAGLNTTARNLMRDRHRRRAREVLVEAVEDPAGEPGDGREAVLRLAGTVARWESRLAPAERVAYQVWLDARGRGVAWGTLQADHPGACSKNTLYRRLEELRAELAGDDGPLALDADAISELKALAA